MSSSNVVKIIPNLSNGNILQTKNFSSNCLISMRNF